MSSARAPKTFPLRSKLSEMELPKFNVNQLKWSTFWDYFSSTIHENTNIRTIDKFHFLGSLLKDRAKMAIEYLPRKEDL